MTSLLKKLSIDQNSLQSNSYGQFSLFKLSTESVDSRCELVANSCIHTADATRRNSTVDRGTEREREREREREGEREREREREEWETEHGGSDPFATTLTIMGRYNSDV